MKSTRTLGNMPPTCGGAFAISLKPSGLMCRFNSGSISLVIPGGGNTSSLWSGLSFLSSSMDMNIVKVTSAGMQRRE